MFEIVQKTLLITTSIATFVFSLMVIYDKLSFQTFAVTNREKIQKVIVGTMIGSIVITVPNLTLHVIFLESSALFLFISTMCIVNVIANKNSKIWIGALVFIFFSHAIISFIRTFI